MKKPHDQSILKTTAYKILPYPTKDFEIKKFEYPVTSLSLTNSSENNLPVNPNKNNVDFT